MSAVLPTPDIQQARWNVRYVRRVQLVVATL
jgi:hypothetical protein